MKKADLVKDFEKKQYGFDGDASIQICEWNKKALRGEGHCYKEDFYGVDCISCHQMTPVTFWCNNKCIFCWRPKEYMGTKPPVQKKPGDMIEGLIKKRAKLISGFGGHDKVGEERFAKGLDQKHWAISLSGEPTLYDYLPELISELKARPTTETIFVVSNGQNPEMLLKLWKKNSLPTQLYISMISPEEKLWKKITCNSEKNGWEKYLKSLAMLSLLPTRTVIRLTMIKGLNDSPEMIKQFSEVLEAVKPDFVEVKSYMWLGYSRKRLEEKNMPQHEEVTSFVDSLLANMPSFKKESEKIESRIVLLKNKNTKFNTKIIER